MLELRHLSVNGRMVSNVLLSQEFEAFRHPPLWQQIKNLFERRATAMPRLQDQLHGHSVMNQRKLGLMNVELTRIVGTVGRGEDFDNEFRPTGNHVKHRWMAMKRAFYLELPLPPVELYKVGEVYYVLDGHHRVSVARANEFHSIEADVIEVIV